MCGEFVVCDVCLCVYVCVCVIVCVFACAVCAPCVSGVW